jgi:LacI family transcriptional regulator
VATITDVARKAGVSVSTVSHVLNGTRRVSPATARAVQEVIDSIGYKPNILARSLKAASSRSVGIAISSIFNPYFSDIICAIESECARFGMMVFLSDTEDDPARELEVVIALHQRRVDGIILAPSADPEVPLHFCEACGCPAFLLIERLMPNSTKLAFTIVRLCASSSIMLPRSATIGSATSEDIPGSRRRSSASPAIAIAC